MAPTRLPNDANLVTYLESRLDTYLQDLRELVGIDSFSHDKDGVNRVNDWLEQRLSRLGFRVTRFSQVRKGDNLLAVQEGQGEGCVLLLGHSDTVFPRGTGWPLTFEGNRVGGPGTCDMKAGLLTGLYALEALKATGFHAFGRFGFLCVSDEEVDDRESLDLLRSTCREYDAVLNLEAARENGDIVTSRKGVAWLTIAAQGRAAHAGVEPEKGRNAIVALARLVVELHELNDSDAGVTVNTGVIEGGRLPNVVPDHASCQVDIRAFSPERLNQTVRAVRERCRQVFVPDVTFTVATGKDAPAMPKTPGVAALEVLAKETALSLGFEVMGASTGGAADAAYAVSEGVPALDGLGPVGGLDHSPNEYILKSSIVPRTALLAELILRIIEKHDDPGLTTKA
jgi:glutamate carboxypeptidase